jgi:hypothetical protein
MSRRERKQDMDMRTQSPHPDSLPPLEAQLIRAYGVIVGGSRLTRALGYPTQAAFRQAVARGRVPVPLFTIPGRRGKFAQIPDIARWVHELAGNTANEAKVRPCSHGVRAGR